MYERTRNKINQTLGARYSSWKNSYGGVSNITLSIAPQSGGTIGSIDIPAQLTQEFGDFVIGGMGLSTNANQSTAISVASGSTVFQGLYIQEDSVGSVNTATSATNYIYIVVSYTASKPSSVAYVATTSENQTNGYRMGKIISTTKVDVIENHFAMTYLKPRYLATVQQIGLF